MREDRDQTEARLSPTLNPDTSGDFGTALASIDIVFDAIAEGTVDAYWGAVIAQGRAHQHIIDEVLASKLDLLLFRLTDLFEFTEEDSSGQHDVESAIRSMAAEWRNRTSNDLEANEEFFARWEQNCDLTRWRDRLGGRLFESLDARGDFSWPDE